MRKQTGYNLIELMIAIVMGLIIIAATVTIYISTIKASADIVKSARLSYDLDSALALMVNDIRRAGYWGGAMVGSDILKPPTPCTPEIFTLNPFMVEATNLQFPSSSCVLYSYDADGDGTPDTNEYYGFRLNAGNIQMRSSNIDCDANGWNTFNVSQGSEQIEVTNLTFNQSFKCLRKRVGLNPDQSYVIPDTGTCATAAASAGSPLVSGDRVIETREISIKIAGHVKNDPTVTRNVILNEETDEEVENNRVKIRNDRVYIYCSE